MRPKRLGAIANLRAVQRYHIKSLRPWEPSRTRNKSWDPQKQESSLSGLRYGVPLSKSPWGRLLQSAVVTSRSVVTLRAETSWIRLCNRMTKLTDRTGSLAIRASTAVHTGLWNSATSTGERSRTRLWEASP
jgi:hypothetical protein